MRLREFIGRARRAVFGNRVAARWFYQRYRESPRGTAGWLIHREIHYGGVHVGVPRQRVSEHDPRSAEEIAAGGMIGGDRMVVHGYAPVYAKYLEPFVRDGNPIVLVEVGILKGTGLAIWSDLFPGGRTIGLDIDPGHFRANVDYLRSRGAFRGGVPEVHVFDQFCDNGGLLQQILGGDRVDVFIDDGRHSFRTILNTMRDAFPVLSDRFVYFVEDNATVHRAVRAAYPGVAVDNIGEMTIVHRGLS